MTLRLERLVAHAHALVYSRPQRAETARHYLGTTLFVELRALDGALQLSIAFLVGGVVLGALWAALDPLGAAGLLPAGSNVNVHTRGAFYGVSVSARGGLAAVIFVHNIEVAFLVIALGCTLGIGTAALLIVNGLSVGVLGVLEWQGGGFSQFLRLVVPHGLLELSCFSVAGAAGFAIARAIVDPGTTTRTQALATLGPRLGAALVAVCAFLVVAGCVEGVITPYDLPLPAALAIGVVLCTGFWTAVVVRGRGPAEVATQARARALTPA